MGKLLLVLGLTAAFFNNALLAQFPIATNATAEVSMSAAFDGTNYLVAIQGGLVGTVPTRRFNLEIQRFSPTGALLGTKVSLGLTDSEPFVAFDGTNYLVVSELMDSGGPDGIYGQRVNRLGSPLGPSFIISHGDGIRNPDAITFGKTNYFVTWTYGAPGRTLDAAPGDHDIYGQLVSSTGQLIGGELKLSGTAGKDSAVAFDGTNFLVIWRDDVRDTDVMGRLVSPSGTFITSEFVVDGNTFHSDNPSAVLFDGTRYLAIIPDTDSGRDFDNWDLFARFITPTGSVLTNRMTITDAAGAQQFPALAFDGSKYLISWSDALGTTNANVKFQFFDLEVRPAGLPFYLFSPKGPDLPFFSLLRFDGARYAAIATLGALGTNFDITSADVYGAFIPGSTESPQPFRFPIADSAEPEVSRSAAFDGTNYLVGLQQREATGNTTLLAQLISSTGARLGPPVSIPRTGDPPLVAFDGSNYLLVWNDHTTSSVTGGTVFGQFLSHSASLVGGLFQISQGASVADVTGVAFDGTNYLVIWNDGRKGGEGMRGGWDVVGRFVSQTGTLPGPEIKISGTAGKRGGLAFGAGNYLVAWNEDVNDIAVLGRLVAPNGTFAGPEFAVNTSPAPSDGNGSIAVGFDGSNFLVVWGDQVDPADDSGGWDLFGQFVTPNGGLAGNVLPISTEPGGQVAPVLEFGGDRYLVSWTDARADTNSNFFCDPGEGSCVDIFGRFIGKNGTAEAEFVIAGNPGQQFQSSLATGTGEFLVVWNSGSVPDGGDVMGTFVGFAPSGGPVILTQPVNQTVQLGQTARFSVRAAGTEPLFYQWELNGSNLPGATNNALTLANAQRIQAGEYTVLVSNRVASVRSAPAILSVLAPPLIAAQPVSQSVEPGVTVTFSVQVAGDGPFGYQWYRNGIRLPLATNSIFVISDAQPATAGSYSVVVANAVGAASSQPARLSVSTPNITLADNFADRVVTNSVSGLGAASNAAATREPGEPLHAGKPGQNSVWLTWVAPGGGTATFTTAGSDFDTLLAVYTGAALTSLVPVASDEDQGGFLTSRVTFRAESGVAYHIAIDGFGDVSGTIRLSWQFEFGIEDVPQFIAAPRSQSVVAGTNVVFSATVRAEGTVTYQWFLKGSPIPGATSSNLVLNNVQPAAAGVYHVEASTSTRTAVSSGAVLEIAAAPQTVSEDKFQDVFSSNPAGPIQLQRGGSSKSGFSSVAAGVLGSQIFNNFGATTELGEPAHGGAIGGASRWFQLRADSDGTMVCDTLGSSIDTVLAVYHGTDLRQLTLIAGDNNSAPDGIRSLVRFAATRGTGYLVAVDGVNGAQGNIRLNWGLGTAPAITQQPAGRAAQSGQRVDLAVAAAGMPAPVYQWSFNGFDLAGATNSTLVLLDFQASDAGSYRAVASNFIDVVTSEVAMVSIVEFISLQPIRGAMNSPFQLRMTGGADSRYLLEASTNLTTWSAIFTNAAPGGFDFADPQSTNFSQRYYRARRF